MAEVVDRMDPGTLTVPNYMNPHRVDAHDFINHLLKSL